jgi:hypothetical protein
MHSLAQNLMVILAVAIVIIIFALVVISVVKHQRPRRLDVGKFQKRWKDIQQLCGVNTTWPLAVINADKLLDEALKKRRIKGGTMGERLVAAQRRLSDNDGAWFGHKLRNRIVHEDMSGLKQRDVQAALRGFREALKDLGAIE